MARQQITTTFSRLQAKLGIDPKIEDDATRANMKYICGSIISEREHLLPRTRHCRDEVYYYVFFFSSFQNHPSFKRYLFIDPEEEESCAVTSEQNHNRLGISRR
jgi:hypothetical protein